MQNKKVSKLLLVLAAGFVLTGCSDIAATPTDYEDKLVTGVADELYNNIASVVYDKIVKGGTTKQEVLDDVLLKLAESKFGAWDDVKANYNAFTVDVNDRIKEKMFALVSGGSYEYRNIFDEAKFAQYVRRQLYKVNGTYDLDSLSYFDNIVFTPAINKDNMDGKVIHLSYYTDYIEGEIVPDIYREKLVEQYLLDNEYSSLGRTYGRKVNYVGIKINDKHPEAAKYLIDEFIDNNILGAGATKATANLEILANAWRGVPGDYIANEATLLDDAGLVGFGYNYTQYGVILSDYAKITTNIRTTDTSIEADFTANNTYPKEVGLEIKTNNLRKQDYTVDGWHIKNGGLTALPEALRTRLFNIGTANGVDAVLDDHGNVADAGKIDGSTTINKYVRNINGNYYLLPQDSEPNDNRAFLLFDAASSTYYIVQIEEAVNTTKLNNAASATRNYNTLGKDQAAIAMTIAKQLASKDSNKSNAMNYYIEEAGIKFHDQAIYDYFEETFPDIFGEDADK